MKRRHFILGLAVTLPSVCRAQAHTGAWAVVPTIVIVSAENDARLPLVHEAVDFWNRSFAELGAAFRLGKVTQTTGALPVDGLKSRSATADSPAPPESIRSVPGNIVVPL